MAKSGLPRCLWVVLGTRGRGRSIEYKVGSVYQKAKARRIRKMIEINAFKKMWMCVVCRFVYFSHLFRLFFFIYFPRGSDGLGLRSMEITCRRYASFLFMFSCP